MRSNAGRFGPGWFGLQNRNYEKGSGIRRRTRKCRVHSRCLDKKLRDTTYITSVNVKVQTTYSQTPSSLRFLNSGRHCARRRRFAGRFVINPDIPAIDYRPLQRYQFRRCNSTRCRQGKCLMCVDNMSIPFAPRSLLPRYELKWW